MVYDVLHYAKKDTFCKSVFTSEEEALGIGDKVVVDLCKTVQQPQSTTLFFDNYFFSIELVKYLEEKFGMKYLGIIREARTLGCPLLDDKALIKSPRIPRTVLEYNAHMGGVDLVYMLIELEMYRTFFK